MSDVTAWLDEIEEMVPGALHGFMADRAPEEAGFMVDAVPRLTAALRAVLALADELDTQASDTGDWAPVREATRLHAYRLRAAVAAAIQPEETDR